MDPNTLLEQLRDVHAPDPITWWPPAIGWWMVAILSLLALVCLAWVATRYFRKNAWRRAALKEFGELKKAYATQPSHENLSRIIVLLRRCLASASRNRTSLVQTGKAWRELLQTASSGLNEKDIDILSEGHYQVESALLDQAALQRIERWIKKVNNEASHESL